MKRLILCAVAVLLTSGALATRPANACIVDPDCSDCSDNCVFSGYNGGICNTCTGHCTCY
jgi:hypothetical protein